MRKLQQADRPIVQRMFSYVTDTIVQSWLDGMMGEAWGNETGTLECARVILGDFCYFGGNARHSEAEKMVKELPAKKNGAPYLAIGSHKEWEDLIESVWENRAKKIERYALLPPSCFDKIKLRHLISQLPEDMVLRQLTGQDYSEILEKPWCADFCSNFQNAEDFELRGLGFGIWKDGLLIGGASSYSVCRNGLEIEIDIQEPFRRQGLASACGAKLVLECLKRGWYPSWDAANRMSVGVAEKIGYQFSHQYNAYMI